MNVPEYTLSPQATYAIALAFGRYLKHMPYGNYAIYLHDESQLARDRIALAATLENCLALECGSVGAEILHAIDAANHEGGSPAFLIHGLPTDRNGHRGITYVVGEALAQLMSTGETVTQQVSQEDDYVHHASKKFEARGFTHLHHDDCDFTILYGIDGGSNPRHTPIYTAESFVDYLVGPPSQLPALSAFDQAYRSKLASDWLELLQLPIWRLPKGSNDLRVRVDPAEKDLVNAGTGLSRGRYAPIIYPNPNYHPDVAGSCKYRFLDVPFALLQDRLASIDKKAVPEYLRASLKARLARFQSDAERAVRMKAGPVLGTGDALIFNNALVIHAGGPYVHETLDGQGEELHPRSITNIDFDRSTADYPIRPGDRWVDAIIPEAREGRSR